MVVMVAGLPAATYGAAVIVVVLCGLSLGRGARSTNNGAGWHACGVVWWCGACVRPRRRTLVVMVAGRTVVSPGVGADEGGGVAVRRRRQ